MVAGNWEAIKCVLEQMLQRIEEPPVMESCCFSKFNCQSKYAQRSLGFKLVPTFLQALLRILAAELTGNPGRIN